MTTVIEQIFIQGKEHPTKIALQDGKHSQSYGDLLTSILSAKRILADKYHVGKGDRVIMAVDKDLEFVAVYFACHLLEAVAVPIAPDTNAKRYGLIKNRVSPRLVIGFKGEKELDAADFSDFRRTDEAYDRDSINFPALDSLADVIFTTGTTGEPKGVKLTQRNIAAAVRNINTFMQNAKDDVEMLALPISHSFGLNRLKCALSEGQTLVLLGSFANVKRFFRFMEEYGVNGFGMVPAGWSMLKKLSGETIAKYADQLHYIEIGSAPMPIVEKELLMKLLPHTRICMHYGLTEASRSAFMEFHGEKHRLDTVGKASPNMTITIRDEHGKELPRGQEGEICISGDAVTVGYLDLPREDYFWGEAFRTGDWGLCDQEGYISLKSRKKELINVGGKKVSPAEIEDVLKGFDFVKDCACIGVADPTGILGEVVKAFIVTDYPEKLTPEYMEKLIGNRLEGYKHPAMYEPIDAVPKTSSGKIQRISLR